MRLSLPFRDPELLFTDILKSVEAIGSFVADVDLDSYQADLKTRSAVERQLQILTEAAVRLGGDAQRLCPSVDWRGVRGMGNVLRHEYDEIDDETIWKAIHERLPPLRASVQESLNDLRRKQKNVSR